MTQIATWVNNRWERGDAVLRRLCYHRGAIGDNEDACLRGAVERLGLRYRARAGAGAGGPALRRAPATPAAPPHTSPRIALSHPQPLSSLDTQSRLPHKPQVLKTNL